MERKAEPNYIRYVRTSSQAVLVSTGSDLLFQKADLTIGKLGSVCYIHGAHPRFYRGPFIQVKGIGSETTLSLCCVQFAV
jgi:hypothetical protein